MTDPLPPLPDHVSSLLRAARDAPAAPPAGAEELVLAKVAATVAPAAALAGAAKLAASGSKVAAWGIGKSLAVVMVGAAIVGGAALLVVATGTEAPPATPSTEYAGAPAALPLPVPVAPPSPPTPTTALPAPAAAAAEPPTPTTMPATKDPTASARPALPSVPEASAAEEILLEAARQALARDDPASAKDKLMEHERRFPNGALREERRALTVVTWVKLGEHERARAAARAFEAQHPDSLFLEMVRGALAE